MEDQPGAKLVSNLRNTLEGYESLRELVQEKQDVLLERDIDRLEEITREEQILVDELNGLESDREQIWGELLPGELDRDTASMETLLDHVTDSTEEELRSLRVDLKNVARDVQRLNRENTLLLENRISVFDEIFEMITGGTEKNETYGPNSETDTQSTASARLVDEAI